MLVYLLVTVGLSVVLVIGLRWPFVWLKYRGDRVVSCPENHRPAGVRLDAGRTAATSFGGTPQLRLNKCSRWPEKAGCGQECLREIRQAPADCLVRNIASRWCEGKACASCGKPIGPVEWGPAQPGLLTADRRSVEWQQVPTELLLETLEAAAPICFACHMANSLVREHPEVVIDRGRHR